MELKLNWRVGLAVLAVLAVCAYVGWSWYTPDNAMPARDYVEAAAAKQVKSRPKRTVPAKTIKVLPKSTAKTLDLPPSVQQDTRQQVLSAVDVPPSEAGAVAVTLLDTDTGDTRTLVKAKPRPFFALEQGNELGLRYGVSTREQRTGEIYYRRDLLRIGTAHVGAYGSLDTSGEARAMLSISARW